jgi:hypothetical protein
MCADETNLQGFGIVLPALSLLPLEDYPTQFITLMKIA